MNSLRPQFPRLHWLKLTRFLAAIAFLSSSAGLAQQESPPVPILPKAAVIELSPDENILFRETSKDLRCPTCQGMSILESDAAFSVQIKNAVKEKIREGMPKDQILQFFTERYGPWILRQPPKTGFNAIAWIFPLSLMILGPLAVWFFVWRKRKTVPTQGIRPTNVILQELNQRLEARRQGARS
jgi:cytochrome c-type biogenesis protein CcmH